MSKDGAQWHELKVLDDLEAFSRACTADSASFARETIADSLVTVVIVTPNNPKACEISIIAEQFLVISVGSKGGRFELGYGDEDVTQAKRIIECVVAGRVTETFAPGRSRTVVTFPDETTTDETGYEGWLSLPLILPYWLKWGCQVAYQPYRVVHSPPASR